VLEGLGRHWPAEVDAEDHDSPGGRALHGRRDAAERHDPWSLERCVHSDESPAAPDDPRSESDQYAARLPLEGFAQCHGNPRHAGFDEPRHWIQRPVAERSAPHDSRSVVAPRRRDEAKDFERAFINPTRGTWDAI